MQACEKAALVRTSDNHTACVRTYASCSMCNASLVRAVLVELQEPLYVLTNKNILYE